VVQTCGIALHGSELGHESGAIVHENVQSTSQPVPAPLPVPKSHCSGAWTIPSPHPGMLLSIPLSTGVALSVPASTGIALSMPASTGIALSMSASGGVALSVPASCGVALSLPLPLSRGVALSLPPPLSRGVAPSTGVELSVPPSSVEVFTLESSPPQPTWADTTIKEEAIAIDETTLFVLM
jgi:hypothetical protein